MLCWGLIQSSLDVYLYYMKPFRQVKQLTNHISPEEVLGGGNYATLLKYKCLLISLYS